MNATVIQVLSIDEARAMPEKALEISNQAQLYGYDPRIAVNHVIADLEKVSNIDLRKGKWVIYQLDSGVRFIAAEPHDENAVKQYDWLGLGLHATFCLYKILAQVNASFAKQCKQLEDAQRLELSEKTRSILVA